MRLLFFRPLFLLVFFRLGLPTVDISAIFIYDRFVMIYMEICACGPICFAGGFFI